MLGHAAAPVPTVALDVGADGGRWSQVLCALGWRAVCTDIDEQTLALCGRRLPEATCILVRPTDRRLPGEDESIGLVLCMEVPIVMRSRWFLEEAGRVLRPNGILVGVFFNKCSVRGFIKHALCSAGGGGTGGDDYAIAYPPWRKRLKSKGFSILQEEGMCWLPFSRTSDSPLIDVFTPIERWLGLRRLASFSPWIAFVAQKRCGFRA